MLVLIIIAVGVLIWYWDSDPPTVRIESADYVNKDGEIRFIAEDVGKGLISIAAVVRQGENESSIFKTTYEFAFLPWQQVAQVKEVVVSVEQLGVSEGTFEVEFEARDQSNLWLFRRSEITKREITLDTKRPILSVLSRQHYITQGGSEAVLYKVQEEGSDSGVLVGDRVFRGFPLSGRGEGEHLAIFSIGYDQPVDVPLSLWAQDRAGNRSQASFWHKVFPGKFRNRNITISDSFIASVAPEILEHSPKVSEQSTPLETFLEINRTLRTLNNQRIAELTKQSEPRLLWTEPFAQLSNSQVESIFADRRTYLYEGKECDQQTHLGFDLASLALSPVEASNSGKVVFADFLGIYGNTVIVDHGLGLFSLYGHLSSLGVEVGQSVSLRQELGQTGQTGLAGGDHLHFSMLLQGHQVNPIEWWDEDWVRKHVLVKIEGGEPVE